jgi:WD40 repeat protein
LAFDELVADVCTLLPGYLPVVKQCASQVYCTLLSFATPELRLRQVYDQTSNAPFFVTFSSSISGINSLAYSIDGNIVASGFLDGSISMWDSEADSQTILPLVAWQAHSKMVLAIAFSPNGTNIVSASSDGTLKIWDVQTRSLQMSLELPSERTTVKRTDSRASLAFSAKGTLLAFTSLYSRKIWSTKTWKEKRFDGPGYNVINGGHCIALSPDTSCFAVADTHGIYVFDLDGLHYIVRDRKSHRHLVFSDDGTMIRSTQGTYDVVTSERVESHRHRSRFSEDLYVDKGWLIDKDGQKRCWVPELPREGDFYAALGNKIVFAGNGRLTFLKLGTLPP